MVIFLHSNKEKGMDTIILHKKEICLWVDLIGSVSWPRCVSKRGLSVNWQSRQTQRKTSTRNSFSPSRCISQQYLHKTFTMLSCQDQNSNYVLVAEILSSTKHFLRCWSSLQWYKRYPGWGETSSLLPVSQPSAVKQQPTCNSLNRSSCAKRITGLTLLQTTEDDWKGDSKCMVYYSLNLIHHM